MGCMTVLDGIQDQFSGGLKDEKSDGLSFDVGSRIGLDRSHDLEFLLGLPSEPLQTGNKSSLIKDRRAQFYGGETRDSPMASFKRL